MNFFKIFLIAVLFCSSLFAETITIDQSKTYQDMEGFGAGIVYYQSWLTQHPNSQDIYDTIFTGLGLDYLRIGNWNQDESAALTEDSIIVANAKERLGDELKILMCSWSAPADLKVSGDTKNPTKADEDQNTLIKENGNFVYDKYASWWKRTVLKYRAKGIYPDAISFQNEPDMNAEYEGTIFKATETSTVAGYPEMLSIAYDSIQTIDNPPQVWGPEVLGIGYGNWDKYVKELDKTKFDGYAYHLYHGNSNDSKYEDPDGFNDRLDGIAKNYSDKPSFVTEFCPMRSHEEEDMIKVAQIINNTLIHGNVSGYINWELIWGNGGQMVEVEFPWDKTKWTEDNGYIVKSEYHAIRHFSKYTNAGWTRVDVQASNLSTTAFKNSNGDSVTVVIVNPNNETTATISIDGYSEPRLVVQSVLSGNKSEVISSSSTITIPENSITTAVYTSSTTTIQRSNLLENGILHAYPNPVENEINVECHVLGKIAIYNDNLKEVKEISIGKNDISDLVKGTYVIALEVNGVVKSHKLFYKK